MRVLVYYTDGRVSILNTSGDAGIASDALANGLSGPHGVSEAVEWIPRMDLLDIEGLSFDVYWYSTVGHGSTQGDTTFEYVSRPGNPSLKDKFAMLTCEEPRTLHLLSKQGLKDVVSIDVDGGVIQIERIAGDWVDLARMERVAQNWLGTQERQLGRWEKVQALHKTIKIQRPDLSDAEVAKLYGFTEAAWKSVVERSRAQTEATVDQDDTGVVEHVLSQIETMSEGGTPITRDLTQQLIHNACAALGTDKDATATQEARVMAQVENYINFEEGEEE